MEDLFGTLLGGLGNKDLRLFQNTKNRLSPGSGGGFSPTNPTYTTTGPGGISPVSTADPSKPTFGGGDGFTPINPIYGPAPIQPPMQPKPTFGGGGGFVPTGPIYGPAPIQPPMQPKPTFGGGGGFSPTSPTYTTQKRPAFLSTIDFDDPDNGDILEMVIKNWNKRNKDIEQTNKKMQAASPLAQPRAKLSIMETLFGKSNSPAARWFLNF